MQSTLFNTSIAVSRRSSLFRMSNTTLPNAVLFLGQTTINFSLIGKPDCHTHSISLLNSLILVCNVPSLCNTIDGISLPAPISDGKSHVQLFCTAQISSTLYSSHFSSSMALRISGSFNVTLSGRHSSSRYSSFISFSFNSSYFSSFFFFCFTFSTYESYQPFSIKSSTAFSISSLE